jgi:hypothetical protein
MLRWIAPLGCALLFACGDDDSAMDSAKDGRDAGTYTSADGVPTEAKALEAWLAAGDYKTWTCEDDVHASRDPSPHGFNRICTNALLTEAALSGEPWPEGAAAVKELYESADADEPMGYAVELKTQADSADGAGWYWYERIGAKVVADGAGDRGAAKSICVSCHTAAGSDSAHTPSAHGRDFVYTPVR